MGKLLSFMLLTCLFAAPAAATIVRLQAADGGTCEADSATLNSHLVDNALRLAQGCETVTVFIAPTRAVLQSALDVHGARQTSDLESLVARVSSADLVQILNTYEFLFGHTDWQVNGKFFNRFQSPDINFTFFAQAILDKVVHELGSQPLVDPRPDNCLILFACTVLGKIVHMLGVRSHVGCSLCTLMNEIDKNDAVLWRFIEHRFKNDVVNNSPWLCQPLRVSNKRKLLVNCVAWSPDGQILATGSGDNAVKLWRPDGTLIVTLGDPDPQGYHGAVRSIAWSPDGQILATGSDDHTVKIWRLDGTLIATLGDPHGHADRVISVAWSSDGQILATGSDDHTVKLWRPDGTLITTLGDPHGHADRIVSLAWSPDGKTLATCSWDRTVKLWRQDGTLIATLGGPDGHTGYILSVAWSPDGQILATVSKDCTAKLWRPDGTLIATLGVPNGHTGSVGCVAWSPDGQILATGSEDHTTKLWRPDGTFIATLDSPSADLNWVLFIAWSPDGQTLATGFVDHTTKLWRPDGTLIATLDSPNNYINWVLSVAWHPVSVAWSPDGQTFAVSLLSHTTELWRHSIPAHANLSTLQKLLLLKFAQQKTLTPDELGNVQPLVDSLPASAAAFIAQCAEQQS